MLDGGRSLVTTEGDVAGRCSHDNKAKGQRSEMNHQHNNLNPGSPVAVLLLVFKNPSETH